MIFSVYAHVAVTKSIIYRYGIESVYLCVFFNLRNAVIFTGRPDKTASRAARLTVHLHIPFLQQLYRATTVRFRGMNSPLNVCPPRTTFLPGFNIISARERERRKVRGQDIRKGRR